jgi:hypothetical protein
MNLINEKVKHEEYGLGIIVTLDDNKLCVEFDKQHGKKKFLYPDAFDHFLELENPDCEEEISKLLRMKIKDDELAKQKKWHEVIKRKEQMDLQKKREKEELAREKKRKAASARR